MSPYPGVELTQVYEVRKGLKMRSDLESVWKMAKKRRKITVVLAVVALGHICEVEYSE